MSTSYIIVIENKESKNLKKVTDYLTEENVDFCILFDGVYVIDVIPDLFNEFTKNINLLMANKGVVFIAPLPLIEDQWEAFGINLSVIEKLKTWEN